jgi:hypothetical protein
MQARRLVPVRATAAAGLVAAGTSKEADTTAVAASAASAATKPSLDNSLLTSMAMAEAIWYRSA